jgi:hypothetical protein
VQAPGLPDPSDLLLVKLADGRIRILPADDVGGRLRRLENESGPIAAAYQVTAGGDWVETQPSARESRNSAIFAASLGMTTGALPNVGLSLAPSGAVKSPVW